MLGLNKGAAELTGFIAREENYTPGFLSVPLEHSSSVLRGAPPRLLPTVTQQVWGSWNYWNHPIRQLAVRQAQSPGGATGQVQIVRRQHRSQMMCPVQIFE